MATTTTKPPRIHVYAPQKARWYCHSSGRVPNNFSRSVVHFLTEELASVMLYLSFRSLP